MEAQISGLKQVSQAQQYSPRKAGTSSTGPGLDGLSPSQSHLGLRGCLGDVQLPLPHARLSCMRTARPCRHLQRQIAAKADHDSGQVHQPFFARMQLPMHNSTALRSCKRHPAASLILLSPNVLYDVLINGVVPTISSSWQSVEKAER